jgi:putative peptide zinc metalloprotease protein
VTYEVISYVYRWVLTFSIIWFLSDFLGPKLKIISQMIAVMSLLSMFIWPAYRTIKNVSQRGRLPDMKPKRVWITATIFAGLIAAFFLLPLPISRIREQGLVAIHPDHGSPVGLKLPATLSALAVKDGQAVAQGQVLATFTSVELQEQIASAQAEFVKSRDAGDELKNKLSQSPNLSPEQQSQFKQRIEEYRSSMNNADQMLRFYRGMMAEVGSIKSPRDGVVSGMPKPSEVGKMFDRTGSDSRPFCTVGDPRKLVVRVPVTPSDYRLLKEFMTEGKSPTVKVYVSGRTDHVFSGRVSKLPESDAKQVPYGLTQRGGGPLAVKQSGDGGQEVTPLTQIYLVEVEVLDADPTMRPGTLVQSVVETKWRSLGWWTGRALATALDIGLY